MKEKLLEQYKKVFSENKTIKSCGRLECITLIQLCKTYANNELNDATTDFGNEKNGFMNTENIHNLLEKIQDK